MKKRALFLVGLVVLLCLALTGFHNVFSFKYEDGIYNLKRFYNLEDNTVDCLVLGSSHAYENINPAVIWEEAGIATYDLCSSAQPMWNTYYYLKEALKTQSPQLVVLDVYSLVYEDDYMDNDPSRIIKNIYGLKPSKIYFEAFRDSVRKENWKLYGLQYIQYHNRYTDLTSVDFGRENQELEYSMGGAINWEIGGFEEPKINNSGEIVPIPYRQEEYYRKIIDLCEESNVELFICVTPHAGYNQYNTSEMGIFNAAKEIAESNSVPFVNFNDYYDEIGMDWSKDCADAVHLSYLGNEKFSRFLAKYLMDNYSWDNHTGSEGFESWEKSQQIYRNRIENHELSLILDIEELMNFLEVEPSRYIYFITIKGPMENDATIGNVQPYFEEWGIALDSSAEEYVWIRADKQTLKYSRKEDGILWSDKYGEKELLIDSEGIYWDKRDYQVVENGINIMVFDKENMVVADAIGISNGKIERMEE